MDARREELIAAVVRAWQTPSPVPLWHRRVQRRLIEAWPALGDAVAALARYELYDKPTESPDA